MTIVWRTKQSKDVFFQKAKQQGYRSRAAYKLLQIQEKFHVIHKDSFVIDIGCAPGSWLQVVQGLTSKPIIGIDLQRIEPMQNVFFGEFDFTDQKKVEDLLLQAKVDKFGTILSDMSPAISGDRESDHYESIELVRCVYDFAKARLNKGGHMVCKLFDGKDTNELIQEIKKNMTVKIFKPETSRNESREIYLVCKKL